MHTRTDPVLGLENTRMKDLTVPAFEELTVPLMNKLFFKMSSMVESFLNISLK